MINKKQIAWKFLINLYGKRALNLDTTFGSSSISLARHFEEVFAFHFDEQISEHIRKKVEETDFRNISVYTVKNLQHLPFEAEYFDVVILHNIEEASRLTNLEEKNDNASFQRLLKEIYRVLLPRGIIFLSAKNKYGYDALCKKLKSLGKGNIIEEKRFFSAGLIKKSIKKVKFRHFRIYSMYPQLDCLSEIMGYGHTICHANITHKERLKSYIFNNRFFKYFSPAIGIIANKNGIYINFIEKLISQIKQNEILPAGLNGRLSLKQYLILIDKVILTIGKEKEIYPTLIVKLPLSDDSFARCRHESNILNDLQKTKIQISSKAPTFYYEGELDRQPFFVSSCVRGFSIDLPIKEMKRVLSNAAEILIKFHQDTSRETVINEEGFEELFSKPINTILQTIGNDKLKELIYIRDYLKDKAIGKKINLVWEHGDFYYENMLVNSKTLEITGVIDWEMSKKESLPLLDMFYLLTRSSMLFERKDFSMVIREKLLPLQLTDFEKNILNSYMQTIRIPGELTLSLLIMYWINHLIYREGIQMHKNWLDENLYKVIHFIKNHIQDEKYRIYEYV